VPLNRATNVPNSSLQNPYDVINGQVTPLGGTANALLVGPASSYPASPFIGELFFNTDINELQTYTLDGWVSVATPPKAPTSVIAVNSPVAYGGTPTASVRFTPSTVGVPAASYTVTSSPGGFTGVGTSSPITVSGLTAGTSYTYTVTASNSYGSATSSASAALTAGTLPPTPTNVIANPLSISSASISFTSPTNTGGRPITSYTVVSSVGSITATGASSPITITGLSSNTSYTFQVFANSDAGPSLYSTPSNTIFTAVSYGQVSVNNTSGSTLTNVVVPVTITANANYGSDFSTIQFEYQGSVLQHWVGNYTLNTSAQVYIMVPSLPTGNNLIIAQKSASNISNVSGMFQTFTNFSTANTVPTGWQLFTNGGSFTSVPVTTGTVGAFTLNSAGGGPISHLATTTNQGVSIAVDTLATPNINTAGTTGQNSILEIVLHGNATQSAITLENGFKYRWDARPDNSFKGLIVSQSLTNNIVTMVLDQTAFQLNTYYPAGARTINVGDLIQVNSTGVPFNQSSVAVSSVTYNGTQCTITYPATNANISTTTVTSAYPNWYYVASLAPMAQGWLNNPYGGTYGTTPINDAGWGNFDETFLGTAQNQTNANGLQATAAIWRAKYVGTTGSGVFSSYVNNVPTGRNFTETGVRTSYVQSYSSASNVVTLATYPGHGLAVGDTVTVSGMSNSAFNGTFTVTQVVNFFSFTYSASTGTVASTLVNPYTFTNGTVTANSTRFSQNGLAGVATHVGSATFNWIAIYPTFAGVSDAVYTGY